MVNRDAFLSSFEEQIKTDTKIHNRDLYRSQKRDFDIGVYSTSGFEKLNDAERLFKLIKKHNDGPAIIRGMTNPRFGLSMRTRDSKTRRCRNSHIDWWIYKDAAPECDFQMLGDDQNENT